MATTRFNYDGIMTKQEEKNMVEFILYLYEAYKKWCHHPDRKDKDRNIAHILYIAVRDITRIIGENKNLNISKEASKILKPDETTTYRGLLNARKANPGKTIKEHFKPANDFYYQFEEACANNKPFGEKEAKKWLKDAVIAIITVKEDETLTEQGNRDKRNPKEAYDEAEIDLIPFIPAKKGKK